MLIVEGHLRPEVNELSIFPLFSADEKLLPHPNSNEQKDIPEGIIRDTFHAGRNFKLVKRCTLKCYFDPIRDGKSSENLERLLNLLYVDVKRWLIENDIDFRFLFMTISAFLIPFDFMLNHMKK